jgi:hypothetical protein
MNQHYTPATPVMADDIANAAHQSKSGGYVLNVEKIILTLLAACVVFTLAMGCSPTQNNPVSIESLPASVQAVLSGSDLKITNNTERDIYFFACPVRLLPVILYTTDVNPLTATNKVPAKTTTAFARSLFSLEANEATHFVWWHLGRKVNDSLNIYRADSVRTFTVNP